MLMKKTVLTLAVLFAFAGLAAAQPLRGSYFLDNSLMRSRLNPAFVPQESYISVPVAGYAGVEILSNAGLDSFLFPADGHTYTFLNEAVAADTFLKRLPEEDPYVRYRIESDLLGGGFRVSGKLYLTAGLSVVQLGDIRIGNELLRFAKTGRSGPVQDWTIREAADVQLSRFAALSVGAGLDLDEWIPGLRAGGRLKLMTGIKAASASLDAADICLEDDLFAASTRGSVLLSGYAYDAEDGFLSGRFGLRGFGAAFDLGLEYRIRFDGFVSGLHLSAAACNIGGLSIKTAERLSADGSASFSGFQDFGSDDFDLEEGVQRITDDFRNLATLTHTGNEKLSIALPADIFAGAHVTALEDKAGFGVLYSRSMDFDNLTVSLDYRPVPWFGCSLDYTFFGAANRLGLYAEATLWKRIRLFGGFEKAAWKTNSRMLGIKNLTESAAFGLNILL